MPPYRTQCRDVPHGKRRSNPTLTVVLDEGIGRATPKVEGEPDLVRADRIDPDQEIYQDSEQVDRGSDPCEGDEHGQGPVRGLNHHRRTDREERNHRHQQTRPP